LASPLRQGLFTPAPLSTQGTARFGGARDAAAAGHLTPQARADAFVFGDLPNMPRGRDRRFRQNGHILTCAPTGAGKGIGAVIPNLIDYPGSAFVLDLKGENYAVIACAHRQAGQEVFVIDPFSITGDAGHARNWLDTLDPDHPDVVSRAGTIADMLVVRSGFESEPHWNHTARDLLRGFLVHVAGLPAGLRNMAALSADYDTAHYISNALGYYTIAFETANRSRHTSRPFKPGTSTAGSEHRHGRSLLTLR
jgi:type IV secretory pathway TraG/TraD family ATPase VirD4